MSSHCYNTCACGGKKQTTSKRCGKCSRQGQRRSGPTETLTATLNHAEVTKYHTKDVRTLKDLICVCEIDTTEWDITKWECNKWEVGSKHPETGQVTVTPLFQVKATLGRKTPMVRSMEVLREELIKDIRKEKPPIVPLAKRQPGPWLFEFAPFDLHMGKHAWGDETVTNYDTDIAEDLFNQSLNFLLTRALKLTDGKLDRILCVFGNDVSHVDTKSLQTTGGTPMDYDSRFIKVYRRICAVHRRAVDILRGIAPVDIKIVPGNHDELTSFHLGEILATRYDGVKHVTVDNGPKLRKYYDYGTNLFGFAHGHAERVTELPLLMAREVPDLWHRCKSREWHIGHKHISEKWEHAPMVQDLHSDKGVRIRRLTSMSAHDAWHTKHAYTDRRACEAFVFHRDAGFTDHLSFNVDHFTGKPLISGGKR